MRAILDVVFLPQHQETKEVKCACVCMRVYVYQAMVYVMYVCVGGRTVGISHSIYERVYVYLHICVWYMYPSMLCVWRQCTCT